MLNPWKAILAFYATIAFCSSGYAAPAPTTFKPVPIIVHQKIPVDPNNILVFRIQSGAKPIIAETQAKYCFNLSEVGGSMTIDGVAGDKARLDIYCGETLMGSCTDTAPGRPMVKRCTVPKVATEDQTGKLTCTTTVLRGSPVTSIECDDP